MSAGELSTPFKVQRRGDPKDDRFGRGTGSAFADVADLSEVWGRLVPRQGGEVSLQARLESRQPWEMLVRRDPATIGISIADRIITLDDLALVLDVKAAAPFQADPAYILITAESGGADGSADG